MAGAGPGMVSAGMASMEERLDTVASFAKMVFIALPIMCICACWTRRWCWLPSAISRRMQAEKAPTLPLPQEPPQLVGAGREGECGQILAEVYGSPIRGP
uniref:Uncharacterized protein n=1 Tax=Alexandrium monilatum TaxID=311494 RepID=A0A7S4W0S5_9DINO|mmetsp:Transcript_87202/g.273065  ORF Transcript_87202/g.273065 Transcript_87202/m.273065 type:complete len:100 (+) Transcript_87202:156-455(+)